MCTHRVLGTTTAMSGRSERTLSGHRPLSRARGIIGSGCVHVRARSVHTAAILLYEVLFGGGAVSGGSGGGDDEECACVCSGGKERC